MGIITLLWQEFTIFKRKFWTITSGAMVAPILYLIAFGWGLGGGMKVNGTDYLNFVIPGIIALTTMTTSFSNIANSINLSRMYDKTFEEYMIAPITTHTFVTGKIIAGAFRGLYSGMLIIVLSFIFNMGLKISLYFIFIMILNCFVFSAIGFGVGLVINSHADMGKFTSFIITPMAFLCGTFFPTEKMPEFIKYFIWVLPLTHTSMALRYKGNDIYEMILHPAVLIIYLIVIFFLAVNKCKKTE